MQDGPDSAVLVRPVPAHANASFCFGSLSSFSAQPVEFPLVHHKCLGGFFHVPLLHEAEELENTL